ncbi:MAG: metalloregulator ArsR/SmtB family transcription factor [Anaerolineaceae bacterium]|nr:metalloregulator ArsR/SmtB family transcription factor [Anaerolineaceae bacterium]
MDEQLETLLAFFKALADATRLKIVGLLAQKESSVEELAATLEVSPSTVSHHLSKLAEIGLVTARADGYYSVYSLQTEVLEEMAQRLLSAQTLPAVAQDLDRGAYDRQVLNTYLAEDGTLTKVPSNRRKLEVVLNFIAEKFEFDRQYSEKEVNAVIGALNPDISGLRRDLISSKYLGREKDGSAYWRVRREQE